MRYYRLRFNHAPLMKAHGNDFNYHTPDALGMQSYDGPISGILSLPEPIFYGNMKAYDYASIQCVGSQYMTITKALLTLLQAKVEEPYQLWPIKAHHRKKVLDYYIFRICYPTYSCFDYKKSEFYECREHDLVHNWDGQPLYFSSFEEYQKELRAYAQEARHDKMLTIRCRKMVFDFRHIKTHIFRFLGPGIFSAYFVSEELKQAIEDAKLTGCRFVDPSEDDQRIVAIFD